jgi:2-dehydropantoate 2-reductase
MGAIAEHPEIRQLVLSMMQETFEIAARLGSTPKVSVERRFEGAAKVGDHKTSMLMDFEAGKPLETDVLLAAPVELARLVGAPAPSLELVHGLIDLLTMGAGSRGSAANRSGDPERGVLHLPAVRHLRPTTPCQPPHRLKFIL